jgi:hypothetical protein
MGTETKPGTRVQAWVPHELAWELKAHADSERLSVSAVIRLALEDRLVGASRRGRRRARARRRRGEVRDRWLRSGFHIAIGDPRRKPLDSVLVERETLLAAVAALPRAEDVAAPALDAPRTATQGSWRVSRARGSHFRGHATDFPSARARVVQIDLAGGVLKRASAACTLPPPRDTWAGDVAGERGVDPAGDRGLEPS